jgi:hypothetical protein
LGTKTYALRFIAGTYKGGEFPLRPNREIVIGRGSEYDMVLDEDMVSRRHAKIVTLHGQIVLQDLKSTNGTFVNGERITVKRLKPGDRVLVGTSIMLLVEVEAGGASAGQSASPRQTMTVSPAGGETPALGKRQTMHAPVAPLPPEATTTAAAVDGELPDDSLDGSGGTMPEGEASSLHGDAMRGKFPDDEVMPSDLVELFCANGRSGVLIINDKRGREARLYLRSGQLYHASIVDPDSSAGASPLPISPAKAFGRVITWPEGSFRLDSRSALPEFEEEIRTPTRDLLLEVTRQWDELRRFEGHLPEPAQRLEVVRPLVARLADLSAEALDTLQLVLNHGVVGEVLDHSTASDLETYQDLLYLLQNGYLTVS